MKNKTNKKADSSFVDMDEQPIKNNQKVSKDVLNQEKKDVLKKYAHMFIGFDLAKIKVLPILVARHEIMR